MKTGAPHQAVRVDISLLVPKGRKVLYAHEIAALLRVTEQHVKNLINRRELQAANIGRGRFKLWQIPVPSYEDFLKRRTSSACNRRTR
jgi:hypothetical protein